MSGPNDERDQQIAAKARLGQTHEAIAAEYGITRARVSQIVAAANPRSAEESQRLEIAKRYQAKYAELQAIIDHPPAKTTAIGKTVVDPETNEVIRDFAVVVASVREQLKIEAAYRAMFGTDLATRPTTPWDEANRQCDDALAAIRARRAAEVREVTELRALTAATPQPGDSIVVEAEIVS